MPKNNNPKPEERFEDLLEDSLQDITVLKKDGKILPSKKPPAPIPTQSIQDEADVLEELLQQDMEEEDAEFLSEEPAIILSSPFIMAHAAHALPLYRGKSPPCAFKMPKGNMSVTV